MILELYRDSLPYSVKDKIALIKLGIVNILSFLIFPIVLLIGYSYRVIEIGLGGVLLENEDLLPPFNDLKELFIQGLKIIGITIAYSLIPMIISILAISEFDLIKFTHFLSNLKIDFQFDFGIGFIGLLTVIWFITFIFTSTAIPHMINRNSTKAAFKIKELFIIIKHVGIFEYFKFFLSFIILAIAFGVVGILFTELILNIINIITLNLYNFIYTGSNGILLTISILTIILSFILIPIFVITESRVASFIYNEDALIEEEEAF